MHRHDLLQTARAVQPDSKKLTNKQTNKQPSVRVMERWKEREARRLQEEQQEEQQEELQDSLWSGFTLAPSYCWGFLASRQNIFWEKPPPDPPGAPHFHSTTYLRGLKRWEPERRLEAEHRERRGEERRVTECVWASGCSAQDWTVWPTPCRAALPPRSSASL